MQNVNVTQLFIYPVKSLRGIAVKQSLLLPTGLEYDRYWMIVDDKGHFLTQRQCPDMALIDTQIQDNKIILSKGTSAPLSVEINRSHQPDAFEAKIWKDTCLVVDEGTQASKWLTTHLKRPAKLVRMQASFKRPQSKPELLGGNTNTFFADAAPFLICNEASLKQINQFLDNKQFAPAFIENFRPNIVISGIDAFAEHQISLLKNQQYSLKHCYPCQRCVIPTINIETGEKRADRQPFTLLGEINPMPGTNKLPAFGENATLLTGANKHIKTGDQLDCRYE